MGAGLASARPPLGSGPPLPLMVALLLPPSLGEEGPMPARAQKRKYTPPQISIRSADLEITNSEDKKSRRIESMKLISQERKNTN